jgi:hypothetical protein
LSSPLSPTLKLKMKIEKRKNITSRFIQAVLWIDDEIIASETRTGEKFREFFQPACEEFARQGFLCHLKGFLPTLGAVDNYVDSEDLMTCKKLIQRADIVIIDWHLGADTPENAVELVKTIAGSKGTKFCVVLSKATNLENEFGQALPDMVTRNGKFLTNDDGSKFFLLLNKQEFETNLESCKELISNIVEAISTSYQDYLHWLAIEIMANVKEGIPTLLANLPKSTDKALMADTVLNELQTTLEFAVSSIGDDLYDIVTEMPLETVATCAAQFEADAAFTELKLNLEDEAKKKHPELAGMVREKFQKFLDLCPSYQNLTKLFEQKSLDKAITQRVYQGAVYKPIGNSKKIWICISQACDCNHKTEVLMVQAKRDDKFGITASGKTFVTFNGQNYVVLPNAACCVSHKVTVANGSRSGIAELEYVGGLRSSVAMRIADRFFSHQTRIGVNQPSIIRELRGHS